MVNIKTIKNQTVSSKLRDFEDRGGRLRFHLFEINKDYRGNIPDDEYFLHLVVARQTLEKLHYYWNFAMNTHMQKNNTKDFSPVSTNHEILSASGQKISPENFLGPFYDLKQNKPIIRGQLNNNTNNSYFYFDGDENWDAISDINERVEKYMQTYTYNCGGFVRAFMEPPYTPQFGSTIMFRGTYLLNFMNYFFDNLNHLKIYSWSTDSSKFFDAGKEWWGTFFWTVYNPTKNWYIGIVGSDTD